MIQCENTNAPRTDLSHRRCGYTCGTCILSTGRMAPMGTQIQIVSIGHYFSAFHFGSVLLTHKMDGCKMRRLLPFWWGRLSQACSRACLCIESCSTHRLTRHGPFVTRLSQLYQRSLASKKLLLCDEVEAFHENMATL